VKRQINWEDDDLQERLGTVPDGELGAELGVTRERVRQVRARFGVRSYTATQRILPPGCAERLGTVPDSVLAREYGVRHKVVRDARLAAGIARYQIGCGTTRGYQRGCRCRPCTDANSARTLRWMQANPEKQKASFERMTVKILASAPHKRGKISWYVYGCRCEACKVTMRRYQRANYAEKKRAKKHAAKLAAKTAKLLDAVADLDQQSL
jgi:hypothetical protein